MTLFLIFSFDDFIVSLDTPELIGVYLYNLVADEAGNVYAIGANSDNQQIIVKTTNDGSPDLSFGDNGISTIDGPAGLFNILYDIKITQSGELLICGGQDGKLLITKRNTQTGQWSCQD